MAVALTLFILGNTTTNGHEFEVQALIEWFCTEKPARIGSLSMQRRCKSALTGASVCSPMASGVAK